ncbi:MAG TPA: hypothetical protein DEG43_02950 [Acidimicrobiaceae bacterium]|nr:hypothetical protein [Acidimicrobiaceae bacterium]
MNHTRHQRRSPPAPRAVVSTLLLVAFLAGCGDTSSESASEASTNDTTAPTSTAATSTSTATSTSSADSLPEGRNYVLVTAVDLSARTLTVDLAEYYTGDEAIAEATKDGTLDESCECVPNDVYTRNNNPKLRTVSVDPSASITVLASLNATDQVPGDLNDLANAVSTYSGPTPFFIDVKNGIVTSCEQIFFP